MRAALLIVACNLIAFLLGVVITLWISMAPAILPLAPSSEAAADKAAPLSTKLMPANTASTVLRSEATHAPMVLSPAVPPPVSPSSAPVQPKSASPSPSAATSPAKSTVRGIYVLRFGAFVEATDAARIQASLRNYGYSPDVLPVNTGGMSLQVVQLGAFADRIAAAEAAASVQHDTGISALVIKSMVQ